MKGGENGKKKIMRDLIDNLGKPQRRLSVISSILYTYPSILAIIFTFKPLGNAYGGNLFSYSCIHITITILQLKL